ncbi:MAG: hypothetical protein QM756_46595 [Polyangiaceae bacterium]
MSDRRPAIQLTHVNADGDCVGLDERGRELWFRGAVPGDWVLPLGVPQRSQRRRAFELWQPAAERRVAPCSVQRQCGGCGLMPLPPAAQRREKLAMLARALEARGITVPAIAWYGAESTSAYRNRVRLRTERGELGFFNRDKSATCRVLEPSLLPLLELLLGLSHRRPQLFVDYSHAELRAPDRAGRPGLLLYPLCAGQKAELSELASALPNWLLGVSGDPALPWQTKSITHDVYVHVPLDAFMQVNDSVNARLVQWAVSSIVRSGARTLLDLYAGAGNFSLPLAHAGIAVSAVERHPTAVRALLVAAREQRLSCDASADSADAALARSVVAGRRFDAVLLDAPRAGLNFEPGPLLELGARSVLLLSCYVPAFARDLGRLLSHGYVLEEMAAFDMFAETHHVESAALLRRNEKS